MGRCDNRSIQLLKKTKAQRSEIPLLKAISAVNILMKADTGGCSKYIPLLASRLRMDEAAVRYVWFHRNEVLYEWDNCVTENCRNYLSKVWKHSFLYGWKGRKRHAIDYKIIDDVAAEWASRRFPEEKYTNVSSSFEIQPGSKMLQIESLYNRKEDLSKFTSDLLEQELNDFLQKYRKEVQKLRIELEHSKTLPTTINNRNRVSSHVSNRTGNGFKHGIDELEKLMRDSFGVLFNHFFIPDHLITQIGRGILTKSKLVWRSYLRKHVGCTRFLKTFRKRFNLVAKVDATHPLYSHSTLIEDVFVRLTRLNISEDPAVCTSPRIPVTDINNNHFQECDNSTENDNIARVSSLNPDSNGKPTKPSVRKRSRKRKHMKPHGKYWRDVVKVTRSTNEPSFPTGPNEDVMTQISDFVSKSLIKELKRTGELEYLYAVLDEEMLEPNLDDADGNMEDYCVEGSQQRAVSTPPVDLNLDDILNSIGSNFLGYQNNQNQQDKNGEVNNTEDLLSVTNTVIPSELVPKVPISYGEFVDDRSGVVQNYFGGAGDNHFNYDDEYLDGIVQDYMGKDHCLYTGVSEIFAH